ncbi:dipeptidase PepE [Diaphorobacter sp. HDW4A]|uniref:dipeptidase PepE n=1 Tax=Diaphorobacter sp. HDW4A TaxID=2714924 RepID=UPI00140D1270|nr:dipeptidase PepE [Diaphorobacter sp. HDW4A]QIL83260.1 dipeptidase PepE [Diaphorobacter sp. HDW4A]
MNLLLLSNSSSEAGYLTHARAWIEDWAQVHERTGDAVFLPFAGVTRTWDAYEILVAEALAPLGLNVKSVHRMSDPLSAVRNARHILVGGGNTFALLSEMRRRGLLAAIRERVLSGEASYMGWSAGSNMTCPTICTTNDMPITDPNGLDAMALVPFQINAHYTDAHPAGHRGETREQRLREFVTLQPDVNVLGIPEGNGLRVHGAAHTLLGKDGARHFKGAAQPQWLAAGPVAPEFLR